MGDEVNVVIRTEDNRLYALSIQSAATPVTMQSVEPTEGSNPPVIEDPTEHRGIDTHEAITTNDGELTMESNSTSHNEVQVTTETAVEGESDAISTAEPTENHAPENHEAGASTTPEHHEIPELTLAHEGTP